MVNGVRTSGIAFTLKFRRHSLGLLPPQPVSAGVRFRDLTQARGTHGWMVMCL
ncbi:hypothetical protein HMPREF0290_2099 [Corynebacterium efficiens YS-314]|nr:hypothetical protein HMPREF0290_2099 [Corynebacterium efficiens YS-314]